MKAGLFCGYVLLWERPQDECKMTCHGQGHADGRVGMLGTRIHDASSQLPFPLALSMRPRLPVA